MGKINQALNKNEQNFPSVTVRRPSENQLIIRKPSFAIPAEESEKYDAIKIRLLTRPSQEALKTILLTGSSTGSGTTTTAVNFAMSLAREADVKVLLIDANSRAPRLHELVNMDYDQALSFMLTQKDSANSFFTRIKENLYVLANDSRQPGPPIPFNSPRFDNLLKAARQAFSFVILDSPTVNDYLDPLLICSRVDGVILVVDAGKTRRKEALNAKTELQNSGANIVGVILNRRKYYIPAWLYKRL